MEIKEILSEFEYCREYFPHKAVEEAVKQKDKIIPELLKVLEYVKNNIDKVIERQDYMAHIYAMFLLAQFREKRAYPLIVNIFSNSTEVNEKIAGDFVCENLSQVLASVCDGDTSLIEKLIENEDMDEYARASGVDALLILAASTIKTREEIADYYKSLFRGKLERKSSLVWCSLVLCSSYLCSREEVYEDVKKAYEEGLADPTFMSIEEVDE